MANVMKAYFAALVLARSKAKIHHASSKYLLPYAGWRIYDHIGRYASFHVLGRASDLIQNVHDSAVEVGCKELTFQKRKKHVQIKK